MIGQVLKLIRRYFDRTDYATDAGYIRAQIAENRRQHRPVSHLQQALQDLTAERLRAGR